MLTFLFLNQTLWCYHSLESSRRDDFNEGHIIGFGWEMIKLSWKPFCSLFLNCSPEYGWTILISDKDPSLICCRGEKSLKVTKLMTWFVFRMLMTVISWNWMDGLSVKFRFSDIFAKLKLSCALFIDIFLLGGSFRIKLSETEFGEYGTLYFGETFFLFLFSAIHFLSGWLASRLIEILQDR